MSAGVELCPRCSSRLLEGTDGNGNAFLDCLCGFRENVVRQMDPHPTKYTMRKVDGRSKRRRLEGKKHQPA